MSELRSPDLVMKLPRLGSFHQTRLSFSRCLLRKLAQNGWKFQCTEWCMDEKSVGHAVYTAEGEGEIYSLVAFSHLIADEMRSDRVIANVWDTTYTLMQGEPTPDDIERLRLNVPLQEAGRISSKEVSLSRANKSVRLWNHVLERLSKGEQPDREMLIKVGYLMRTTAVYGSGKFGAADRSDYGSNKLTGMPFAPEMLSVYLTRQFVVDLIEYEAKQIGGDKAAELAPELKRLLGIGNSTGLGMGPFVINHPILLNNWILARENALAEVLSVPKAEVSDRLKFKDLLLRSRKNTESWNSEHDIQIRRLEELSADIDLLTEKFDRFDNESGDNTEPWRQFYESVRVQLHPEGEELLVTLLLEIYPEITDRHAETMSADEEKAFLIPSGMTAGDLKSLLQDRFSWTKDFDFSTKEQRDVFWYVSEEKLEPRLGKRFETEGADLELPLDIARMVSLLGRTLSDYSDDTTLADFLILHPEHRHTVRRVCQNAGHPYSEIRDNTIGKDMLPLDLLRCKLSFFGADKFDPRSDRWVRICLFQNAPYPQELSGNYDDLWIYPPSDSNVHTQ